MNLITLFILYFVCNVYAKIVYFEEVASKYFKSLVNNINETPFNSTLFELNFYSEFNSNENIGIEIADEILGYTDNFNEYDDNKKINIVSHMKKHINVLCIYY